MEQAGTVQPKYQSPRSSRFWNTVLRFQSYFGLIAILVLSTLVSPVRNGHNIFLDPNNLLNIVRFASENGIIAIGMTLVILIGGIDLSVGAVMALCAVGAASFMMRAGLGTLPTVALVLSIGAPGGHDQRAGHHPLQHPVLYRHAGHAQHCPRAGFALVGRVRHPARLWHGSRSGAAELQNVVRRHDHRSAASTFPFRSSTFWAWA